MEQKGMPWKELEKILQAAREKNIDFSGGRIMGSMITRPHDVAIKAHQMFIESNLGNTRLYPGTKELEDQVIEMLAEILHGEGVHGSILNGGTESNITALWLAKKHSGKRRVIFPESAHFSIKKAVDLLGLEGVPIGLNENFTLDLGELEQKLSDETAAVIAMAGSTELGVIDPVAEIAELTEGNCFLHVDAAFGGMIIPFLLELGYELPDFDFKIPGVDSIAVDPHKMGRATIPAGALLFRDIGLLDKIAVDTPYLTMSRQAALAGTRNSAAVAGAFAVMRHLGREGYTEQVKHCMEVTRYCQKILDENEFKLVMDPILNILAVDIPRADEVERLLAERNWWVSKTLNPPALRMVIMPHVTAKTIDEFIPDLISVCKSLGLK